MRATSILFPAGLALALLAGLASPGRAAPTAGGDARSLDEARLSRRVEQEQQALDRSGFVAKWPEVDAYLNGVLNGLGIPGWSADTPLRVNVIVDPTLNAFILPNGTMYIHTGMLSRLENEAQLAAVLGHEVTHATHRHGLKTYRSIKNHSAFLATLTVGTGGVAGLLGSIGVMASVSGHSQDLEREADVIGLRIMRARGYDPREAPKVFEILRRETKRSKITEPFFFGSHPRLSERIESYQRLVAALPKAQRTGETRREAFEAVLPQVLVGNAEAALNAGDHELAEECARRALALRPGWHPAEYQLGEMYRRRGKEGDVAKARQHYALVAATAPDFAPAHRGLGLAALRSGDKPAAAEAFRRYLELAPRATDRGYIETYLKQCESSPSP